MATNLAIFGFSLLLFLSSQSAGWHGSGRNDLLKQTSSYSPLLDRFDVPVKTVEFNGSLFNLPRIIYREEPGPEVDAAWDRISQIGIVIISEDDVRKAGKDPTRTVRAPEDWGYGTNAHIAQVEVFHQLHCLNAIRKALYYDHYLRPKYGDHPTELHWTHLSHCLHIVQQNIMCHADLSVITHNWVETQRHPWPDFNVRHQCRDFDAVWKWHDENQVEAVEGDKWERIRKPDNVVAMKLPDEITKAFQGPA